jgi:hypothetical protein
VSFFFVLYFIIARCDKTCLFLLFCTWCAEDFWRSSQWHEPSRGWSLWWRGRGDLSWKFSPTFLSLLSKTLNSQCEDWNWNRLSVEIKSKWTARNEMKGAIHYFLCLINDIKHPNWFNILEMIVIEKRKKERKERKKEWKKERKNERKKERKIDR